MKTISVIFLASLLLMGCQSPTVTHEQAQTVLESRMSIRQQLGATKTQLDSAVAALNEINGKQSDELVAAFGKYSDQIALLDAAVAQLKATSDASAAEAQSYFDTAATKIEAINDPVLKNRATARRNKALSLAGNIDNDTKILELAYQLFIQRLRDIQAYFAADLTSGCVRSIQDQFAQTNADVPPIKAKSDQLSYDLELGNELMNTGEVQPATTSTSLPTSAASTTPVPTTTTLP